MKLPRKHARGWLVSGVPFILTSFLCGWITDACMVWLWFCPMVVVGRGYTGWQRPHSLRMSWCLLMLRFREEKKSPHFVPLFNFALHLNFFFFSIAELNSLSILPESICPTFVLVLWFEHDLLPGKHSWSLATNMVIEGLAEVVMPRETEPLWVKEYLCLGTGNSEGRLVWSKLTLWVLFYSCSMVLPISAMSSWARKPSLEAKYVL